MNILKKGINKNTNKQEGNMTKLEEILRDNNEFVENKEYEKFSTSKKPNKKIVILSCMDTRLTSLLPSAMNIKNGDVKLIKNAGAVITHPFGSTMRSIIVSICEFDVDEVMVVGHYECGMCNENTDEMIEKIKEKGISEEVISTLENAGIDLRTWLHGFDSVEQSIKDTVKTIKNHPLIPSDIAVHGLAMDPATGKIDVIVNGYENK